MSSEPVMSISGIVHYLARVALVPNSTLHVSLLDVSLADAPAKELAVQTIQNAEINGLGFTLTYSPADVLPGHSYAISASIKHDNTLVFTTTEQHSVLLDVNYFQPQQVRVSLV